MRKTLQKALVLLLICMFVFGGFSNGFAEEADVFDSGIVTYGTPDANPPKLVSYTFDKTTVKPGETITLTITAADDISGIGGVWATFRNFENGRTYNTVYYPSKLKDGIYTDVIKISPYELDGNFQLEEVELIDKNENRQVYRSKFSQYLGKDDLFLPQELSFTVNNDSGAVITNTSNPDLADTIKNMVNGKTAAVNYKGNPHIAADVFDAIKDTDKKLVLESEGIQRIFNGKNIKTSKDLDLKVDISTLDRTSSANADEIEKLVNDIPTLVLSFPNNGQLPGLAKIRIKADYTFRKMLGAKKLNVYYYDNTEKKLKLISSNVDLTGDGWLEFCTDHNSDFVVTSKATGNSKPSQSDDSDDSTDREFATERPAQTVNNPNTGRLE